MPREVYKAGIQRRVHVSQKALEANRKYGRNEFPTIVVAEVNADERSGFAHERLTINGPSVVKPTPFGEGPSVCLFTEAEIVAEGKARTVNWIENCL